MPTLVALQKKLEDLKNREYVPSTRRGPTGIGHTFEEYLELNESNLQIPDLGGRIEIKTVRRTSGSLVTMFTFNRGVWKLKQIEIIRKYGYVDSQGRESLYCSIWQGIPNTLGFSIDIDKTSNILTLKHGSEELASWSLYRLVGALLYKLGKVLFVIADSRKKQGFVEEFYFNEAYLLDNPSEKNFIDAIKSSRVCLDIRMHINKKGSVRNHGTGFRMRENDLYLLYGIIKKLI